MPVIYIGYSRYMDEREAISLMRALGEPTRLRLMLLLANTTEPQPAGIIAQKLGVRQNTLSAHIAALAAVISSSATGAAATFSMPPTRERRII